LLFPPAKVRQKSEKRKVKSEKCTDGRIISEKQRCKSVFRPTKFRSSAFQTPLFCPSNSTLLPNKLGCCADKTQNIVDIFKNSSDISTNSIDVFTNFNDILSFVCTVAE